MMIRMLVHLIYWTIEVIRKDSWCWIGLFEDAILDFKDFCWEHNNLVDIVDRTWIVRWRFLEQVNRQYQRNDTNAYAFDWLIDTAWHNIINRTWIMSREFLKHFCCYCITIRMYRQFKTWYVRSIVRRTMIIDVLSTRSYQSRWWLRTDGQTQQPFGPTWGSLGAPRGGELTKVAD
jgi:hypothetical protein